MIFIFIEFYLKKSIGAMELEKFKKNSIIFKFMGAKLIQLYLLKIFPILFYIS